jgi:OOP family OmpA-OmpF porin
MKKLSLLLLLLGLLLAASNGGRAQNGGADKPKTFVVENHELKPEDPILFFDGSDRLKPESEKALNVVKDYLDAKTYITLLRVEGHTDADGDSAANQKFSERRALAVARRLVEKGVDCKRLLPVGFGSGKPLAPNDTAENKSKNRRIVFVNATLRGRPIGGMPIDGGGKTAGDPCAQ